MTRDLCRWGNLGSVKKAHRAKGGSMKEVVGVEYVNTGGADHLNIWELLYLRRPKRLVSS